MKPINSTHKRTTLPCTKPTYLETLKDSRRLQDTQQVASQSRLSGVQVRAGTQMQARTDNTPKNALAQDETDS